MSDPISKAKALYKEEKSVRKALETPEEKRLRRLAKKEAKERKRKELMGWDNKYTNRDNPFGDSNLEANFVWKKKYQALGVTDIDEKEIERLNKRRVEETKRELEQVKKRRLEREKAREERLAEMDQIQRQKEMATFEEWEKQEDMFHLKQAKLRSRIRLKEGREKPIDIIARYIDAFGERDPEKEGTMTEEEKEDEEAFLSSPHIQEPYKCLNGLRKCDLEDLEEDIKVYMEVDKERNLSFWRDMQVIVEDELGKLKKYKSEKRSGSERREGINKAVVNEVTRMFEGKSPAQLQSLKQSIEKKINSGDQGIDYSYWETLLSKLKAFIARARLRELHQVYMAGRLTRLNLLFPKDNNKVEDRDNDKVEDRDNDKVEDRDNDREAEDRGMEPGECGRKGGVEVKTEPMEPLPGPSRDMDTDSQDKVDTMSRDKEDTMSRDKEDSLDKPDADETSEEEKLPYELVLLRQCQKDYESGRYSPTLSSTCHESSLSSTHHESTVTQEEDERRLVELRSRVQFPRSANHVPLGSTIMSSFPSSLTSFPPSLTSFPPSLASDQSAFPLTPEQSAFEREARKGMSTDEVQFSVEESIVQGRNVVSWSDKYKPRKPRYFNRVHTGFEWNKYNQTHYDVDNPPPKIVQGYKFNLFYPDLIDKNTTPTYKITKCSDNPDFAIIRFSAGPPYEDIAFKIVNREWNYSYKSGFRCQFSNNILQLWFHFKRYRYRR